MRGAKPGERRGGRTAGTPNKISHDVASKLAALKCDPIEGMARIAMDPKASLELRGRMNAELAQYVYPKRKAIELTGAAGSPIAIDLNVSPTEQLRSRIARVAERVRA